MNQQNVKESTLSETQALNYERGLTELKSSLTKLPNLQLRRVLNSLYVSLLIENHPETSEDRILAVINDVPLDQREEVRVALWKLLDVSTSDILQANPRGNRTKIGQDYTALRQEMLDRYRSFGIPKTGSDPDNMADYRKFVT